MNYCRITILCTVLTSLLFANATFAHSAGSIGDQSNETQMPIDRIINEIKMHGPELIVKYKRPSYLSYSNSPVQDSDLIHEVTILDPTKISSIVSNYLENPDVDYVVPNYQRNAESTPNDPKYVNQWSLNLLEMSKVWDLDIQSEVVVAVLDSGIDPMHEDLMEKTIQGYNFVQNNNTPWDDAVNSHGTKSSGIISAVSNNGKGIAGMAPHVKIMPLKVLDNQGRGYDFDIIEAIYYAVDHGANVINLSLGGPGFSQALWEAVKYADQNGVVIVAASGNQTTAVHYPAAFPEVIAVGAINNEKKIAYFSNFGKEMDVVAPGVNILSTARSNQYVYDNGTSFATPIVSGVAALLKGKNPTLTPQKIKWLIESTATDGGATGWDQYFGYGIINPFSALTHPLLDSEIVMEEPRFIGKNKTYSGTFYYPNEIDTYTFVGRRGEKWGIHFSIPDYHIIPAIKLIDEAGNIIHSKKGLQGNVSLEINIDNKGTYKLVVYDDNGHWSKESYQLNITQSFEGFYGDFNGDSHIDLLDSVKLSRNLPSNQVKDNEDLKLDSNGDGVIDLVDLGQLFYNMLF
jgi:hypothetical protein